MSITITIFSNDTVTSNGSSLVRLEQDQELILFWNIVGPITGTNPTIYFWMQEVDPSDETTPNGTAAAGSIISTTGANNLILSLINSGRVMVFWEVGGTNPSFSNVNLVVISKSNGNKIINTQASEKTVYDLSDSSVIYIGTAPLGTPISDAAWHIKKVVLDVSGSPLSTLWSGYTAIWNNRTTESYS